MNKIKELYHAATIEETKNFIRETRRTYGLKKIKNYFFPSTTITISPLAGLLV